MAGATRSRRARAVAAVSLLVAATSCDATRPRHVTDAGRDRARRDAGSAATARADPPTPADRDAIARAARVPAPIVESAPRFSPDGRHVAFVANSDGAPKLYLQELGADSPPRAVFPIRGRFRRPVFSPDGRSLYYTSDRAGDEAFRIHRIDLASGTSHDVAVDGALRRDSLWPTQDGTRVLFTARPMQAERTELFELALTAGASPSRVLSDDSRTVATVRGDGRQAVLLPHPNPNAIFVAALPSGVPRRLHPSEDSSPAARRGTIHDVVYSPDGNTIYVATDDGTERTHLLALEAHTGRIRLRHTEPREPGGEVHALCATSDRIAFVIDLGTHHEVRVLDAASLAPLPAPMLPLGSEVPGASHPNNTHGLSLSPDGSRLAVQWSTPSSPSRIQLVDVVTGRATPLTRNARPAARPVHVEVVRIPSFDGLEIPTLVYGAGDAGPRRPVVMSIHGGFPFAATARYDAWLSMLLDAGYVVVEPNVRGSAGFGPTYERADDGAKKLDGVRDFRVVGEWIRARPWADSARMAVFGPSAGGYYTLMALAHQPELWRVGIAVVPLYDIAASMSGMDGMLRRFWDRELVPQNEPAILSAISPSTYVDRIRAPLFVYGAVNDVRTPIAQIDLLVHETRSNGLTVEYMRSETSGHSRSDPRTVAEMNVRMLRFLRTHLQ